MHNETPTGARLAARLIMIDKNKRVLFLRATEPKTQHSFWVLPGGGLEAGESFEDAALREAHEETGCTFELGPYVWYRRHKHIWNGKPADQYERFYVAHTSEAVYNPTVEDDYIFSHSWLSMDELNEIEEEFAPRNIRNLLVDILKGVYPEVPFDCGI